MNRCYFIVFFIALSGGCRRSVKHDNTELVVFHPSKKIKDLTYQEALEAKKYYTLRNQTDLVIKSLERAVQVCQNTQEAELLILELGDKLFETGEYEKSQKIFREFKNFYPGSTSIKYALYQEIMSHHLAALATDRDQTTTRETITLAQAYLNRFDEDEYSSGVKNALKSSYRSLYDHELNQVEFYINKFGYDKRKAPLVAAQKRLKFLEQEIMPYIEIAHEDKLAPTKNLILAALGEEQGEQESNETVLAQEQLPEMAQKLQLAANSLRSLVEKKSGLLNNMRDRF